MKITTPSGKLEAFAQAHDAVLELSGERISPGYVYSDGRLALDKDGKLRPGWRRSYEGGMCLYEHEYPADMVQWRWEVAVKLIDGNVITLGVGSNPAHALVAAEECELLRQFMQGHRA